MLLDLIVVLRQLVQLGVRRIPDGLGMLLELHVSFDILVGRLDDVLAAGSRFERRLLCGSKAFGFCHSVMHTAAGGWTSLPLHELRGILRNRICTEDHVWTETPTALRSLLFNLANYAGRKE